jgi:hypothetical protein
MAHLPVSKEMVDFAMNVARATIADQLDWETTADESVLIAPLGGPYTAKLEHAARYNDHGDEYWAYELTLQKSREELLRLDDEMLNSTTFSRQFGSHSAYAAFNEIWTRAILKAKKLTEELNAVNKLLGTRLPPMSDPIPEDDEDVPF